MGEVMKGQVAKGEVMPGGEVKDEVAKKIAYIGGPYRARTIYGTLQNIRAAEAIALKYWGMGMRLFARIRTRLYLRVAA